MWSVGALDRLSDGSWSIRKRKMGGRSRSDCCKKKLETKLELLMTLSPNIHYSTIIPKVLVHLGI